MTQYGPISAFSAIRAAGSTIAVEMDGHQPCCGAASAGAAGRISASLHMISASATRAPSTVTLPCTLATVDLRFPIVISIRSWSPGTTGRRNFALVDRREEHGRVYAIPRVFQHQHTRDLSHGFDDQDAGHNWKLGKVALEKRFIGRDILDADDALGFKLDDAVDQPEG